MKLLLTTVALAVLVAGCASGAPTTPGDPMSGMPGMGGSGTPPTGLPHETTPPVPGFTPLAESDVGQAAWRLGQSFAEVVFDGWTPAQLAAVPAAPGLVEADLHLLR